MTCGRLLNDQQNSEDDGIVMEGDAEFPVVLEFFLLLVVEKALH